MGKKLDLYTWIMWITWITKKEECKKLSKEAINQEKIDVGEKRAKK